MSDGVSLLSLAATGFYGLVVLACIAATGTAISKQQQAWHRSGWIGLALLFVALMALRGFGAEEMLRDSLRSEMRSDGSYDERRQVQEYMIAAVVLGAGVLGFGWLYRVTRWIRGRRNVALLVAFASAGVMSFLVVLRLISLHAIDRFLYGPLKLNWVGDIGTSAVILGAALYYVNVVRGQQTGGRKRRRKQES